MFFTLMTLFTAISLATVAAWFSIVGLMAIFPGATAPIFVMGTALEVGKLVTASWLYRNRDYASFLLTSYLTLAVVVLMFITSMGIFGFLSKAHLEQVRPTGNNLAKIERIDQRIIRERRAILDFEIVIDQLDGVVNTLIEYDRIRGKDGSIAVRSRQKEERKELMSMINEAHNSIDSLADTRFKLSSEIRDFELEVGPIRYVAELIYEDPKSNIETAVRWVIIILVSVFDPLAVLLLIAANNSVLQLQTRDNYKEAETVSIPPIEDDSHNKSLIDPAHSQERTKGGWLTKGNEN